MIPDRYWKFVDKDSSPDGCWLWTGAKARGYGKLHFNGKVIYAHRLMGMETFGEESCRGVFVCHKCDVRACVNPDHLWLGTALDNIADMVSKERQNRGEVNGMAKLTENQVLEIKRRYRPRSVYGKSNIRELEKEFGVCFQLIFMIVKGKRWKHLK